MRIARGTGWTLVVSAVLVIVLRRVGVLPAYSPLSGIGVGLLAVSLLGLTRGSRGGGRVAAILALLVALAAVWVTIDPQAFAESLRLNWTVAAVLLAGSITFVIASFTPRSAEQAVLGVGGFVLAFFGWVALLIRALGLLDQVGARGFENVPIAMAIGTIMLGGAALLLAWTEVTDVSPVPRWAPLAAAMGGIVASLLLWSTLAEREQVENTRLLAQAAQGRAASLEREIVGMGRVMLQFASYRDPAVLPDARALVLLRSSLPTVDAIALIDSVGMPAQAIVEREEDLAPIVATVPPRAVSRTDGNTPFIAYLEVPGDSTQIVVHAAHCSADRCAGGVAAVVSPAKVNALISGAAGGGWRFTVSPPHAYQRIDEHVYTVPLRLGTVNWTLAAAPVPGAAQGNRSILPEVALMLGLLSTALLTVAFRLGAAAWENARAVERMRIAAAITTATDAIWEWDVESDGLRRSGELWRHLDYDPAALAQTLPEWLDLVDPADRPAVADAFRWLLDGHRDEFDLEYRVRTRSGGLHTMVDRGRVVDRDDRGTPIRALGITADVTASRLAERELREVEALSGIGRIAARVAHEINNPLAGIRSAFLLIKDAVPGEHPHRHYVGAIEREIDRIAAVTRSLYETYRPEQESRGASLSTVVNDAVALLGEVNRAANVELRVAIEGVPPVVPMSGGVLRQIVYNLLQNAIDASPSGGMIDVLGRTEGADLVIEVRDQGHGVPEALRERIFEPFFTTKEASVRTGGLGLGLAMVARSVSAAGGTIAVGDTPGGGATFTVRLPITKEGTSA